MPGYSGDMFPYGRPDGFGQGFSETDFCRTAFRNGGLCRLLCRLSVNNSYKPFQSIKEGQSGVKVLTEPQKQYKETSKNPIGDLKMFRKDRENRKTLKENR